MRKEILFISLSYTFIFASIYCLHNYSASIIVSKNQQPNSKLSIMDCFNVFKFFGSFFWSKFADRSHKHTWIIAVGLAGHIFFYSLFVFGPTFTNKVCSTLAPFIYKSCANFFISAVFPVIDSFTLSYLETIGNTKKHYSKIRMFPTIGRILSHLTIIVIERFFTIKEKPRSKILLSYMYSSVAFIFLSIVGMKITIPKFSKPESIAKSNNNIDKFKSSFNIGLILILITITAQGIPRQALTTFNPKLFDDAKDDKPDNTPYLYLIRTLPELFTLYGAPHIEKKIGKHWTWFYGISIGLLRPFSYAVLGNLSLSRKATFIFGLASELMKGIFSSIFEYSGSRIMKDFFTPDLWSFAQGLANACFSGLASCLSGVIGYFLLSNMVLEFKEDRKDVAKLFLVTGFIGLAGLIPCYFFIRKFKKNQAIPLLKK